MYKYQYVLFIKYLGFKYHGYQKQTNAKTVQEALERTLKHIIGEGQFKTFSSSRTDTQVSAMKLSILLSTVEKISPIQFIKELNTYLPSDIEALSCEQVKDKIDIIGDVEEKTYQYFFCFGEKMNPLAASLFAYFPQELNISEMQKALECFAGEKNYRHYCYKPNDEKTYLRSLKSISIKENDILTGNFLPKKSFVLTISGKGFLRYQIRLIMGALVNVGLGEMSLEQINESLTEGYEGQKVNFVAPAAGLILANMKLNY